MQTFAFVFLDDTYSWFFKLLFLCSLMMLTDKAPADKQYTSHNHHIALMRTNQTQNSATTDGSHNLRNTDGSVEQAQISTHVTIALQGIGNKGERHCQHGCPTGTNHQEWNKLQSTGRAGMG